jgi:hypothetical protein
MDHPEPVARYPATGEDSMYEDTERFVDLDFEQRVRQTAYHLWEDDGRPFGRETVYWFRALEKLLSERRQSASSDTEPDDGYSDPASR